MSDIEKAIRKKLSQVDVNNIASRRKVYEAIWNAHEQYLINNVNINNEERTRRRNNLTSLIKKIEQDFHVSAAHTSVETNVTNQNTVSTPNIHNAPSSGNNSSSGAPSAIHPDNDRAFYKPENYKRHGLKIPLLSLIILLILGGIGWFYAQNNFNKTSQSSQQKDMSAQKADLSHNTALNNSTNENHNTKDNTSTKAQTQLKTKRPSQEKTRPLSQDLLSDDSKRSDDGWVRVFTPNDVVGLEVKGGAKAQIINTDGDSYVRISSQAITDTTVINIGSGALDPLRGHTITIDILARSNTDKPSQLIATCDFGNKIECGRIRFEVSAMRDDFLFNVKLPANSSGPGKIYLTSDYSNKNQSIDIYRVFIRKND